MFNKIVKIIIDFLNTIFNVDFNFDVENNQKKLTEKTYVSKSFMTNSELIFYKKLVELELIGDYKVIPQVNLASIISKISKDRFQSELYRNIDFAIFNKDLTTLLLLIELNDSSHNNYKRKVRDDKVKNICKSANIKLITFYTKYNNKKEYIHERVLKEINTLNEKSTLE